MGKKRAKSRRGKGSAKSRQSTSRRRRKAIGVRVLGVLGVFVTAAIVALGTDFPRFVKQTFWPEPVVTVSGESLQGGECGTQYVLPLDISQVDNWQDDETWTEWADRHDGVIARENIISVNFDAPSPSTVTLTGIDFIVDERRPPLQGSHIVFPCGDQVEAPYVQVDLDEQPPQIIASSSQALYVGDEQWRTTPLVFPWTVSQGDPVTLMLHAQSEECYCSWHAEVSWQAGEQTGTAVVDDNGSPFEVTSPRDAAEYGPDLETGIGWSPQDPN